MREEFRKFRNGLYKVTCVEGEVSYGAVATSRSSRMLGMGCVESVAYSIGASVGIYITNCREEFSTLTQH